MHVRQDGDRLVTVVYVSGEVDMSNAEFLAASLRPVLAAEPLRIVIDLSDVSFLAAAGLHVLLHLRREAEQQASGLVLRAPSPAVRRVIDITGMHRVFDIDDGPPAKPASSTGPGPAESAPRDA